MNTQKSKSLEFGSQPSDSMLWIINKSFIMPNSHTISPFWSFSDVIASNIPKKHIIFHQNLCDPFTSGYDSKSPSTSFFITSTPNSFALPKVESFGFISLLFTISGQNCLTPTQKDFLLAVIISLEKYNRIPIQFSDNIHRFIGIPTAQPKSKPKFPPEYLPLSTHQLFNQPLSSIYSASQTISLLFDFPPSISNFPANTLFFPFPSSTIPPFTKTTTIFIFHQNNISNTNIQSPLPPKFNLLVVDPGSYHSSFKQMVHYFVTSTQIQDVSIYLTHHHRDHIEGVFQCFPPKYERFLDLAPDSQGDSQGDLDLPKTPKIPLYASIKTLEHLTHMGIPHITRYFNLSHEKMLHIPNWTIHPTLGHTDGHSTLISPVFGLFLIGDHCVGGSGSSSLDFSAGGKVSDFLASCESLEHIIRHQFDFNTDTTSTSDVGNVDSSSQTSDTNTNPIAIPAHGPIITHLIQKLQTIRHHRLTRCTQVQELVAEKNLAICAKESQLKNTVEFILDTIYPNLPTELIPYATSNIYLALEYIGSIDSIFLDTIRKNKLAERYAIYRKTLKFQDI